MLPLIAVPDEAGALVAPVGVFFESQGHWEAWRAVVAAVNRWLQESSRVIRCPEFENLIRWRAEKRLEIRGSVHRLRERVQSLNRILLQCWKEALGMESGPFHHPLFLLPIY